MRACSHRTDFDRCLCSCYLRCPRRWLEVRLWAMNFKGIKNKVLRFKQIFEEHWSDFVSQNPRYDTDYYQAEISKMLTCGSEASGFAVFQCLCCGKGEHKVNFSCKSKACPQCGKRYARESMCKIATRLFPGVGYRQVVLTSPKAPTVGARAVTNSFL